MSGITDAKVKSLISIATHAGERAIAPYSSYKVGAALLAKSGSTYDGMNVEMVTYSGTVHAERRALNTALENGEREFVAIAIITDDPKNPFPCGYCLQDLAEYNKEGDLELIAANLAGMAFSNSQVALAHSLGHSIGAVLRLQHGLSVGMALPNTIEFNINESDEAVQNYAQLARVLGVTLKSDKKAAKRFAEMVRELMDKVGSPTSLKAARVKKKDFKAALDQLVDFSMQDAAITMNPRNFESGTLRKIYEYMYVGTPIDF